MTHTYNMSTMDDLKQIVQFLTQLLNKLETNMTTLNVQVGLHFDKIEVLEGKLDVGGNFSSEGSNNGKQVDEEEGYNNNHPFSNRSHNLMPHLPKVHMNKFDGLDSIGWFDLWHTTFPSMP